LSITKKERVFGLDLLRAIAITLVVVSHATYIVFPDSEHVLITLTRVLGAIGVDLFFVLSGFLIGGILLKLIKSGKTNFSDLVTFWKRRWFRTLPNYFLVLLFNIVLCLLIGVELPNNISNYFLFLQNFNQPHPNFFTEAWSLSVEEYAYVILPLLFFLGFKLLRNYNRSKLFLWVTIVTILILFLFKIDYFFKTNVTSYKHWSGTFRKVVLYRLDAIYIGFVIVYLARFKAEFIYKQKGVLAILGTSMLLLLHLIVYWLQLVPEINLVFYVFIYLQVVLCSLALLFPYFSTLNYLGKGKKIIEFISERSYAIYLVNYSIVLLSLDSIYNLYQQTFTERIGVLFLFLFCTLLLSHFVYKYFERPILKYRNRKYAS